MGAVKEALADAKAPAKRENALHLVAALFNAGPVAVEPFAVPLLPLILERCSDKVLMLSLPGACAIALVLSLTSMYGHEVDRLTRLSNASAGRSRAVRG